MPTSREVKGRLVLYKNRPRVEESVSTMGSSLARLRVLIAAPSPTTPFRAELLMAIYAVRLKSGCLAISLLVMVCTLFSHGGSANGWIVPIPPSRYL